jgi:hypothetical protein
VCLSRFPMKNPSFISIRQLASAAIICLAATALAQPGQQESRVDAALADLASQDLDTRNRALTALLAQSGIEVHSPSTMRVRVNSLLRTHPQDAERIKTALIAALESVGAEYEKLMREDQELLEEFSEYSNALADTVSVLHDPRSASALLMIGDLEGVGDICPSAVDAIIQRSHAPELSWRGASLHANAFAVRALGYCLQRPTLMRASAGLESKIKRELLTDLDSPDWSVRVVAAEALSPLRTDPGVRAKLQRAAASDPYFGPDGATNGGVAFTVREMAARSLNPPDALLYYVARTSESRVCRVQPSSQAVTGERFIGPETADFVRRIMCSHYDPTGQDSSLCWKVEPANVCSQ